MTLPNERRMAVIRTRDFLLKLLNPKETPKVPLRIRQEAALLLRHFPNSLDMDVAKINLPEIFGEWND